MVIELDEWLVIIQANPILSGKQCNDLRESMHAGVFDITKIQKVFSACSYIDFLGSHTDLWKILINVCCNHLFDDDAPEDDTGFIYDQITKTLGDSFLRELDKASIPIALRTEILLAIESQVTVNLSSKLADAINEVNI